jgi:hypothetical protein
MNTYEVHCILPGHPVERAQTEHSFAARKEYAQRHGVGLTDCYAKRVWDDGATDIVHTDVTQSYRSRRQGSLGLILDGGAKFAVKVTVSIAGKTYGANGTKFVTHNSGGTHKVPTREAAEALIAKCKAHAITGVDESYEIVTVC